MNESNPGSARPEHVVATSNEGQVATTNPLAGALNVTVSVPETIDIVMVDASAQSDFEFWLYLSSILSNFVVGWLVAYFQSPNEDPRLNTFLLNTAMFAVLFFLSVGMSLHKRSRVKRKSTKLKMRVTEIAGNR